MPWSIEDIPSQQGRVAVITGANGGLGLATAKALAGRGAHIVMAARNQTKAAGAREELLREHPDASVEIVELDLGSLESIGSAAQTIIRAHDHIDLLINNAGLMAMPQTTTADGFDMQFGVNHLGHWALTSHLLPTIVRTRGARIVSVSSTAQHSGRAVDPDDPHMRDGYDAWRMYGQTKLANRHFAVGLSLQFERAGLEVKSLACHPGLTNSDLQARTVREGGGGPAAGFFHRLVEGIGMSNDVGALSQLRAATDPEAPNGGFYGPLFAVTGPPVLKPLIRPGEVDAIRTLWEVSERETGLTVDVATAMAPT